MSFVDASAATPDLMLRDADIALYAAKENGRGRYEIFDPEARSGDVDMLATEQALRLALRNNELCVHYQPTVELTSGRVTAQTGCPFAPEPSTREATCVAAMAAAIASLRNIGRRVPAGGV